MDNRRRAIMGIAKSGGGLPSEYQQVEYLESTGEQYIDTNLQTNLYNKIELDWLITRYVYYDTFLGARIGGDQNVLRDHNGELALTYSSQQLFFGTATLNTRYKCQVLYGEGVQQVNLNGSIFTANGNRTSININTFIFAVNRDNTVQRYSYIQVYSCKLFNNDTLLRDFVPCYRKSDNVAGLYDLVNNVFYTNANTSASTDFIIGNNV